MSRKKAYSAPLMSPFTRLISGIIIVAVAVGILLGAALVAFHDPKNHKNGTQPGALNSGHTETESWPKSIGQVFGLLAATLVFLQFGLKHVLILLLMRL